MSAETDRLPRPARPRELTITVYLFLFAVALMLPVFVLAASVLVLFLNTQQNVVRVKAEQRANAAASLVGHRFARLQEAVQMLAGSPLLRGEDLQLFRSAAVFDGIPAFDFRLVVTDAYGEMILLDNGWPEFSTFTGDLAALVRQAASRHSSTDAGVTFLPLSERTGILTSLAPVRQQDHVKYLIAAVLETGDLSYELKRAMPPDVADVMVASRTWGVVARTDGGALGLSAADGLRAMVMDEPAVDEGRDGSLVADVAAVSLPNQDWAVVVHMAAPGAGPAQRALGLFGLAGLTLIGFGVAAALIFAQRISRSVRSLAALGIQLVHEPATSPLSTPIAEVNEVSQALTSAAKFSRELELELRQAHKMEAIGRLTGGIAHDFNNLLTIIIGNLEMLARDDGSGLSEEQSRFIADAQQSAALSADLVNQLLSFARKEPIASAIADIGRATRETAHLLARTLGDRIELKIHAPDGLYALVDLPQFETVILNLAINARDAMPDGGTLSIEAKHACIADDQETSQRVPVGRYAVVAVTDTGIGMTSDARERAFEPFFTTKPPGVGSGLGLSVVYGFAKQSGGDAWIRSEIGRGTTVEVWIPEADEAPTIVAPMVDVVATDREIQRI